jgi:4-O-beta-D-mannosyl-D-glucose phosphorylase
MSSALASIGIARTRNLKRWERLDDLQTKSPQLRNVVLHPEFVEGKYAFYTRPMKGFLEAEPDGGIGWGLSDSIEHAKIEDETVIEELRYHTVSELKNGLGPAPIKTGEGWLHLAHGVRGTAAGLRYVLTCFMADPKNPSRITHRPGGYLIAPRGEERVGDVSNVLFSCGWVVQDNGDLFIYYGASDTRMHVVKTTVAKLVDYVKNTPEDGGRSAKCVRQRIDLIEKNLKLMEEKGLG